MVRAFRKEELSSLLFAVNFPTLRCHSTLHPWPLGSSCCIYCCCCFFFDWFYFPGLQGRAARQLLERIQSHGIDARLEALKELAKLSADATFATEFINMEGIGTLARLVESGTQWARTRFVRGMAVTFLTEARRTKLLLFFQLRRDAGLHSHRLPGAHGPRHRLLGLDLPLLYQTGGYLIYYSNSWLFFFEIAERCGPFQIAGYVNQPMVDVSILQRSLAILESMVLNSHSLYHRVAQEITVGQLIGHLQVWAHTHAQRHSHALWYVARAGGREGRPVQWAAWRGAESAAVCQWRARVTKPTTSYCVGFKFLPTVWIILPSTREVKFVFQALLFYWSALSRWHLLRGKRVDDENNR